jgi:hypothetical protein
VIRLKREEKKKEEGIKGMKDKINYVGRRKEI